jgi:hypothetical protein
MHFLEKRQEQRKEMMEKMRQFHHRHRPNHEEHSGWLRQPRHKLASLSLGRHDESRRSTAGNEPNLSPPVVELK